MNPSHELFVNNSRKDKTNITLIMIDSTHIRTHGIWVRSCILAYVSALRAILFIYIDILNTHTVVKGPSPAVTHDKACFCGSFQSLCRGVSRFNFSGVVFVQLWLFRHWPLKSELVRLALVNGDTIRHIYASIAMWRQLITKILIYLMECWAENYRQRSSEIKFTLY